MTRPSLLRGTAIALALVAVAACGGGSGKGPFATAKSAPGGSKDPDKWPADDKSMCDYKGKPELEVSEMSGPGALKPNIRRVYKVNEAEGRHKVLACREVDTNLDGIKDTVRTFTPKGEALKEEADTDYDGRIDVWITFVDGRLAEEHVDTNHDGKADVWKYYQTGQLQRIKRDENFDGTADVWEIFDARGRLERVGVDASHDGHVDRWDRDEQLKYEQENAEKKARDAMSAAQDGGAAAPSPGGPQAQVRDPLGDDRAGSPDGGAPAAPRNAPRR